MTRLRRLLFPLLVAAALAGAGCFTFRRPEVVFRGVELGSLDSSGAALEASFDVTNPNRYRIGVQHLSYRFKVNGRDAGGGAANEETVLEPKATTLVKLPLTLDWSKVKSAGLDFLFSGGIDYAVEGEITFSTPIGVFERPYRHAGRWSR
ncbi:MAG TPA: LEA type 2 family protein [Thermoanaerobaculia bacterium]|nr:LEA type 2 family protein [Thermoanaerobaculia bacterium]